MEVKDCNGLSLDEACVIFKTKYDYLNPPWLYSLMSDCVLCPYKKIAQLNGRNTSFVFSSAESWSWRLFNVLEATDTKLSTDKNGLIHECTSSLGQYGVYEVDLDNTECEITTITSPTSVYLPLVVILAVIIGVLSLIVLGRIAIRRVKRNYPVLASEENGDRIAKKRIQSIDTFRGISILTMIFVNNGAGNYKILEHATWNGLFVGDLVFPCFIWIMGMCIPIALTSQLSRGISRWKIFTAIIKRSFLLFFIGVCLNTLGDTAPELRSIRIFGVLQRFSVAYLIVGLIYIFSSPRGTNKFEHGIFANMADCLLLLPQWIIAFVILIGHCYVTFGVKVPDCPAGYLGPGGLHDGGKWFNCTGGAAGYIDRLILGTNHLYQRPTIALVYGSGAFDPEGLLGCLTTIFQTFLGVQAGKILRVHSNWSSRVIRWMILALICGSTGAYLHFENIIPVNKNLWSISFVLVTTSFALVLLTTCYLLVDVAGVWNGGPFRIPGMNALVMYIGHQMCYQIFPFHWQYGAMNTHAWRTIAALWDVSLWAIIAYILHRKRIYISL